MSLDAERLFDLSLYLSYENFMLESFRALDPSISQFSTGGDYAFKGTFGSVWNIFGGYNWDKVWCYWLGKAKDATVHRSTLTAKN